MPTAVVHGKEAYVPYVQRSVHAGYEPVKKQDVIPILRQLEAVSPYGGKPTTEMELGMTYFSNGLRVTIWTSVELKLGTTRVGWDSGKVVITESGKVVYYGPEIRRTEHFFDRLWHWTLILKARVDNRPTCKHCGKLMGIWYSENNQYYWYCKGAFLVPDHPWYTVRWDNGLDKVLPAPTLKFLKDKRERTRKYNRMRIKQGKPKHGTARKKRVQWWNKGKRPARQ